MPLRWTLVVIFEPCFHHKIKALPATCTEFDFFLSSVLQRETLDGIIHVRGCIHAVNLWMGDNIGATIGICCAVGLPQVL